MILTWKVKGTVSKEAACDQGIQEPSVPGGGDRRSKGTEVWEELQAPGECVCVGVCVCVCVCVEGGSLDPVPGM